MRILFIWPNRDTFGVKPLGISLLSAVLRRAGHLTDMFDTSFIDLGQKDYNAELTKRGYFKPVDYRCDVSKLPLDMLEELQKKIDEFKPDLFMLSVLDDEVETAVKIVVYLQDNHPGHILIGNKGARKMRECYAIHGCSFFVGEAVGDITDIIERKFYVGRNCFSPSGYFRDLDCLPYLDWSVFDLRHFLRAYDGEVYRSGDHMIGWGCPNSCTYCINESWRELHGGMRGCMRRYMVDRIVGELFFLKNYWKLGFFKFHDEDFLLKPPEYFKELSIGYSGAVGLPFSCMTNAKSVTPARVKVLAAMGCVSISLGIETGDPVMRTILNRRETPKDIVQAVRLLNGAGIRVSSFNMIGLPYESVETIKSTIALNRLAGIKHPNISFYIPLEGTRLYNISVAAGFYKPGTEVRTDRPSLKQLSISEADLYYYYDNFHHLVTEE